MIIDLEKVKVRKSVIFLFALKTSKTKDERNKKHKKKNK